jgi:hypothetical protein
MNAILMLSFYQCDHQIQGQYSSDQKESLEYILEDCHGIIYFDLL